MATPYEGLFKLDQHPSRVNVNGVMVPMLPAMRQVKFNDKRIAYCGAPGEVGYALTFIVELPDAVKEAAEAFCLSQGCLLKTVSSPPTVAQMERAAKELEEAEETDDDLDSDE